MQYKQFLSDSEPVQSCQKVVKDVSFVVKFSLIFFNWKRSQFYSRTRLWLFWRVKYKIGMKNVMETTCYRYMILFSSGVWRKVSLCHANFKLWDIVLEMIKGSKAISALKTSVFLTLDNYYIFSKQTIYRKRYNLERLQAKYETLEITKNIVKNWKLQNINYSNL